MCESHGRARGFTRLLSEDVVAEEGDGFCCCRMLPRVQSAQLTDIQSLWALCRIVSIMHAISDN
jgi:hypothetical protein